MCKNINFGSKPNMITLTEYIQEMVYEFGMNYNRYFINRSSVMNSNGEFYESEVISFPTSNGDRVCLTLSKNVKEAFKGETFDLNWLIAHKDEYVAVNEHNRKLAKIVLIGIPINKAEFESAFGIAHK